MSTVVLTLGGIRFAHFLHTYCRHTKGAWAGQPVDLEPWQLVAFSELLRTEPGNTFILDSADLVDPWDLFETAVERPDYEILTGSRVYREAYIQTSEKTGKSTIAAGLEIYLLGWDGEAGSEVYTGATTVGQANIIFGQAKQFVEKSPSLSRALTTYKEAIYHPDTDSVFRVLSSEAMHDEGLNPHGVVLDELWAHPDRTLYDALTSRIYSGTRADPLAVSLSNAGVDTDSIAFELYSQAKAVLEGKEEARDDLFAFIPEIPEGKNEEGIAHIDDPDFWKEANPQSWVTKEMLVKAARRQPPYVFRRRRLNAWVSGEEGWLPVGAWDECADPDVFAELFEVNEQGIYVPREEGLTAYPAVDIAQKRDRSAVTKATILDDGRIAVWTHVWGLWADKSLPAPPAHEIIEVGEKIPVGLPEAYLMDLAKWGFHLPEIGYDPYKFVDPAERLDALGFEMIEWPQTDQRMVPASEALFELITDRGIVHDGSGILSAHVQAGVAVEAAQARGWRLHKGKAKKPIDALIAMVMAVAAARANLLSGRPTVDRIS